MRKREEPSVSGEARLTGVGSEYALEFSWNLVENDLRS
jgi:hypothetical protein